MITFLESQFHYEDLNIYVGKCILHVVSVYSEKSINEKIEWCSEGAKQPRGGVGVVGGYPTKRDRESTCERE